MCDPALIAAILEELGYLDNKKEKDKKDEVREKERNEDNLKNSGEGEKWFKSIVNCRLDPTGLQMRHLIFSNIVNSVLDKLQ